MFNKFALSLLLFAITCVAIGAANQGGTGESLRTKAPVQTVKIQPRLLGNWHRRDEGKAQPHFIIVNSEGGTDRHHSHHHQPHQHYPSYFPYPYPMPQPNTPPFNIPGLADYFRNGNPSIIIVNPNNAQNLTFPAAPAAAAAAGTGRNTDNRRSSIPIVDLLQGLNSQGSISDDDTEAISGTENAESEVAAAAPPPLVLYGNEERDEDYNEDEVALLERQAARGLSTRNLLSFLLQDKRRRRIQEAVAGIYLRNYNVNRK